MSYKIAIPFERLQDMTVLRTTWFSQSYAAKDGSRPWICDAYSDILSIETYWVGTEHVGWEFVFESEEHYNWFLLQQ